MSDHWKRLQDFSRVEVTDAIRAITGMPSCAVCGKGPLSLLSEPDNPERVPAFQLSMIERDLVLPAVLGSCMNCGFIMLFRAQPIIDQLTRNADPGDKNGQVKDEQNVGE